MRRHNLEYALYDEYDNYIVGFKNTSEAEKFLGHTCANTIRHRMSVYKQSCPDNPVYSYEDFKDGVKFYDCSKLVYEFTFNKNFKDRPTLNKGSKIYAFWIEFDKEFVGYYKLKGNSKFY